MTTGSLSLRRVSWLQNADCYLRCREAEDSSKSWGPCQGEEGRGWKEGGCAVMETKEEVFPGGHGASVLRAVVKANKKRGASPGHNT